MIIGMPWITMITLIIKYDYNEDYDDPSIIKASNMITNHYLDEKADGVEDGVLKHASFCLESNLDESQLIPNMIDEINFQSVPNLPPVLILLVFVSLGSRAANQQTKQSILSNHRHHS